MLKLDHSQSASTPVLREPIPYDTLIQLLEDAVNQLFPVETRKQSSDDRGKHNSHTTGLRKAQIRFNAFRSSISSFKEFLAKRNIPDVQIDEKLILDFEAYLKSQGAPASYIGNHRNQIRKLVNLLPSDMRQREIGTMEKYHQAHRWDGFSVDTPEILKQFLKNGRKMKRRSFRQEPELTASLLSLPYREQVVRETLTFLKVLGAKDILAVTADDVEEFIEVYEAKGKQQTALGILDYIHPLFSNLLAQGKIGVDPLVDVPRKKYRQNLDYVPQDAMDKLADLSTVNMNDFMDVRDRLLSFTIYYDFALRNLEGALLMVSNLNLNGHTCINLPREIQKIQREDSLLFSYFPETTRPLIERYLDLRAKKRPSTDTLIIAVDGDPLQADGCRLAVKDHCDRLGVKTFEGKTPTPHRLRHSFGTLNITPLGRCLDIIEVKEQYRHSSIETTYDLYVGKNTILKTNRYEARMRVNGIANGGRQPLNGNGFTSAHPIASVPAFSQPPPSPVDPSITDKGIPEDEAIRIVRRLGVNYRKLREYGLSVGKASRNGRGYDYSAQFISDLSSNYLTAQESMDLLKMSKSAFFRWRNSEGVECIQVGQVGLYRQDQILLKKRAG